MENRGVSEEQFFKVKTEINKLENIDADKVKSICIQLLDNTNKDLRLFVYLIFACMLAPNTLDEWQQAVDDLLGCLIKCQSDLYPKRPAAKMAALSWLNQERVKLIFVGRIQSIAYENLLEYQKSIVGINAWLAENIDFLGEKLTLGFEHWLKDCIKQKKVEIDKELKVAEKSKTVEFISTAVSPESTTPLIVTKVETQSRPVQYSRPPVKINERYESVLKERDLVLLRKICNVI